MKEFFEERTFKQDGINDKTYELLFEDNVKLENEDENKDGHIKAFIAIDTFTKIRSKKDYYKAKIYLKNMADLNKINYNKQTKKYEYKDENIEVEFEKLSSFLKSKKYKEELESEKRYRKCFDMAFILSSAIKDSKITTGYIKLGKRIFHTLVEKDGYIFDWTHNLVMKKEDYIKITKFTELSSFYGKDFADDIKLISGNIPLSLPVYYLFRDEIMSNLEKNKDILVPAEGIIEVSKMLKKIK